VSEPAQMRPRLAGSSRKPRLPVGNANAPWGDWIFAACSPGLEPVLARELSELGLSVRPVEGGVEAEGEEAVALACLGSRIADAVKARLWEGDTRDLSEAKRDAQSRFPGQRLEVRRCGARSAVSIDAVGGPLYKRGWRSRVGVAPLRESLAAGLLRSLGYDGSTPFLDPMCGSGTIAIEAALIAAGRAPGLDRRYAFESWPGHEASRTAALRSSFAAAVREPAFPVIGADRNGGAIRIARRNAAAALVTPFISLERRDAASLEPPSTPGVCLANPPYGLRLETDVADAWRALGTLMRRLGGWRVGVLSGSPRLAARLPGTPVSAIDVRNGGLRCEYLVYRP